MEVMWSGLGISISSSLTSYLQCVTIITTITNSKDDIPGPLCRLSAPCPPLHCARLPHRLAVAAVVVVDAGALKGDDGGHGGAGGGGRGVLLNLPQFSTC